ncbi:hypothetical protein TorRG33x02_086000 [Trema orientale]|uniref:Uncharacterized protein n=1 Tax=Trema orientale TaxID=63057 RepID=A0A2P5FDA3_TREOI|nr:hypothetical protein TorRG33x02_086000 [Trema orientale]
MSCEEALDNQLVASCSSSALYFSFQDLIFLTAINDLLTEYSDTEPREKIEEYVLHFLDKITLFNRTIRKIQTQDVLTSHRGRTLESVTTDSLHSNKLEMKEMENENIIDK